MKFKFFKKINTNRLQTLLSWHNGLILIGKMATIDTADTQNFSVRIIIYLFFNSFK